MKVLSALCAISCLFQKIILTGETGDLFKSEKELSTLYCYTVMFASKAVKILHIGVQLRFHLLCIENYWAKFKTSPWMSLTVVFVELFRIYCRLSASVLFF